MRGFESSVGGDQKAREYLPCSGERARAMAYAVLCVSWDFGECFAELGEVEDAVDASCDYIDAIVERVSALVEQGAPPERLREIDIETCGVARIRLDGLAPRLHLNNLVDLYKRFAETA